jgi:Domain of unknown function (DUF4377)
MPNSLRPFSLASVCVVAALACAAPPPESAGPPPDGGAPTGPGAPTDAGAAAGATAPINAGAAAGATAPINAGAAAGATAPAAARVEVLKIDAKRAPCSGEGARHCLRVKRGGAGDWQLFYDPIEGFSFEEGYRYELKVRVEPVAKPAADASSLRYVLVEVVKKERAP